MFQRIEFIQLWRDNSGSFLRFATQSKSALAHHVRHSTMNEEHLRICSSAEWAEYVERDLLPWALGDRNLGDDVLEVGPGPGLTTDVLRQRVTKLTAVEVDPQLAA